MKQNLDLTDKKINFLTIAVGKSFPTFIAITFRDICHNGETTVQKEK